MNGQTNYNFIYKGKSYSGYIICNTDADPHFYWFVFHDNDPGFADLAFKYRNGILTPIHSEHNPSLIEIVSDILYKRLEVEKAKK